jgi:hypothetical protein
MQDGGNPAALRGVQGEGSDYAWIVAVARRRHRTMRFPHHHPETKDWLARSVRRYWVVNQLQVSVGARIAP